MFTFLKEKRQRMAKRPRVIGPAVRRAGSAQTSRRTATEREARHRSGKNRAGLKSQYRAAGQAGYICKRQGRQRHTHGAAKLAMRAGICGAAVGGSASISGGSKHSGTDGAKTAQLAGAHFFSQHGCGRHQCREDGEEAEKNRKARPKAGALADGRGVVHGEIIGRVVRRLQGI